MNSNMFLTLAQLIKLLCVGFEGINKAFISFGIFFLRFALMISDFHGNHIHGGLFHYALLYNNENSGLRTWKNQLAEI